MTRPGVVRLPPSLVAAVRERRATRQRNVAEYLSAAIGALTARRRAIESMSVRERRLLVEGLRARIHGERS